MKTTLAGLTLALLALLGPSAGAQDADKKSDRDRDAAKQETIRGVVAGVTIEGETTVDYTTHRAQTAEAAFLTVVGSPVRQGGRDAGGTGGSDNANRGGDGRARNADGAANRRQNVYVLVLSPKTAFRDATARGGDANKSGQNDADNARGGTVDTKAGQASLEKLEVGDRVRITFVRRDLSSAGGNEQHARWAERHGRHRTFFGDATTVTILSVPDQDRDRDGDRPSTGNRDRDDDKDKVQSGGSSNDSGDKAKSGGSSNDSGDRTKSGGSSNNSGDKARSGGSSNDSGNKSDSKDR